MSDFRRVTDEFWASPQVALEDIAEAARQGFTAVINNRPEGESDDQPPGDEVEQAAQAAGLSYTSIPVTHAGFNDVQVDAMVAAIQAADGPVLAYCRSGTRSTLLWALAQARLGRDPRAIAALAADAGYDVSPIGPLIEMLAQQKRC